MATRSTLAAAATVLAVGLIGCGAGSPGGEATSANSPDPNAREVNPPGDIPDNQAYVAYSPPRAGFSVKVPEGWSRSSSGAATTFTDKLNSIRVESARARRPLTVAEAKRVELSRLARTVPGFRGGAVSSVARKAGRAVRITYLAAATANPVTGKAGQDAVERYVFFRGGRDAVLTLSGPKGADNVDPWRIVTDSLRWTG